MLGSRLGMAAYMLMPNDWVWAHLSPAERASITAGNAFHNNKRPDYADPELYRGGEAFDLTEDRLEHERGRAVAAFLDRYQPRRVLELGPGSGFFTRQIVEHPAVQHYTGLDINRAFLDYLAERIPAVGGASFDMIEGTAADIPQTGDYDAVVMLSTVHHIPDRGALFRALAGAVRHGGATLAIDPPHYLLRIRQLARKALSRGYLENAVRVAKRDQMGTHHMCRIGEYRSVGRQTGWRVIDSYTSGQPRKVQALRRAGVPMGPLWRWTSQELAVTLER